MISQTTPKTLLSSFLPIFYNPHVTNWSKSDISNFQDIGKIHWKILITSSSRDRSFPKKIPILQDPREHPEYDAKIRL